MIASADVVVIGSGAFGASAAYHLARGLRVAVLERSALASQTPPAPPVSPAKSGDAGAHQARPARGGEARGVHRRDRAAAALHPEWRADDRAHGARPEQLAREVK